jgi:hypothetical protein
MIEQFHHTVTNSLMLWFDHFLLKKGQAFSNITSEFFPYNDERLNDNFKVFGSPFKQWVTDSSISGASIPNEFTTNTGTLNRDSGAIIDFENGRVLVPRTSPINQMTGTFAVKDFNIYYTNDTEEDLVIENKYSINSRIPSIAKSYISPYDQVIPAVFLSISNLSNQGFALGGMENTKIKANAVILTEDAYQLDGVLSIFNDSRNETFSQIPMSEHPQNEYGDLKTDSYNYVELSNQYKDKTFYVEESIVSKLQDKARKSVLGDLYVGFVDMEIHQHRYRS